MADFVFNTAKGRLRTLVELPEAADSLIVVPLEAAGLAADATLVDVDFLDGVLSNATEHPMGRKTLAGITSTVDDSIDAYVADSDDVEWIGVVGNPIGCLILAYKPDAGSADTAIIPMVKYDFQITPNGGDIAAQVNTNGLFQSL